MPINALPERSDVLDEEDSLGNEHFRQPWIEFFRSVFYGLFGWRRSLTGAAVLDFPNIAAGAEASLQIAVKGARAGDAVTVTPDAKTAGVIDNYGLVTANDTV